MSSMPRATTWKPTGQDVEPLPVPGSHCPVAPPPMFPSDARSRLGTPSLPLRICHFDTWIEEMRSPSGGQMPEGLHVVVGLFASQPAGAEPDGKTMWPLRLPPPLQDADTPGPGSQ